MSPPRLWASVSSLIFLLALAGALPAQLPQTGPRIPAATVRVNGKYGVVDAKGKFLIEAAYPYLGQFSEGVVLPVQTAIYGVAKIKSCGLWATK